MDALACFKLDIWASRSPEGGVVVAILTECTSVSLSLSHNTCTRHTDHVETTTTLSHNEHTRPLHTNDTQPNERLKMVDAKYRKSPHFTLCVLLFVPPDRTEAHHAHSSSVTLDNFAFVVCLIIFVTTIVKIELYALSSLEPLLPQPPKTEEQKVKERLTAALGRLMDYLETENGQAMLTQLREDYARTMLPGEKGRFADEDSEVLETDVKGARPDGDMV